MYTRLNKHRTKKYYREIINQAIIKTDELLKMSPEIQIYHSIYNQLIDINEKIVKNNLVFSENELSERYSLGELIVKNFDLENDEYAQKLSDSFGGMFDYHKMPEKLKQKLFDGDEEKCLKEVFEIENQKIKLIDFYNNPLRDLKKVMNHESFDVIIKEGKFNLINSFIEKYVSEDGLEIHYLKNNDAIYLFSYGEYQNGRYMLFLESILHYTP
jgi:hypothetical protein